MPFGMKQSTYLLLGVVHLLPLGSEQFTQLSEGSVGILALDSLTVVLDEEHVCGKGTDRSA